MPSSCVTGVLWDTIPPFICAVVQRGRCGHHPPTCRWGNGDLGSSCEQLQPQCQGEMEGLGSSLLACLSMSLTQLPWAGCLHEKEKPGRSLIFLQGHLVIAAAF